jgi:hypothetical protein
MGAFLEVVVRKTIGRIMIVAGMISMAAGLAPTLAILFNILRGQMDDLAAATACFAGMFLTGFGILVVVTGESRV